MPDMSDRLLFLAAKQLDELEHLRIATENRLRMLTRSTEDKDGQERGLGLPENHASVARFTDAYDGILALEKRAIKDLTLLLRQHPLGNWGKARKGIGEKGLARLLGLIGDPYWNSRDDKPRTRGALRAYCGIHVVNGEAPRRRKGVQSNWSGQARKQLWVMADVAARQGFYRPVYEAAREHYTEAVHVAPCAQCGGKSKSPAAVGSPLRDGHKHARGIRAVMKQILEDLWDEARTLHETLYREAAQEEVNVCAVRVES